MVDEAATSGSDLLSGNSPAAGAAGAGTVAGAAAGAAAGSGKWYDSFAPDLKGYVENKGWKEPADLLAGYQGLEKLLGGEKLPMPKNPEDKDGWNAIYDKLGRPKVADDYKLPIPEGDNGDFAKAAQGWFHEVGLSQKQGVAIAEKWNGMVAAHQQAALNERNQKSEADMASIKGEWGSNYDANLEAGRRAARTFGFDQETLNSFEGAVGTAKMLKLMAGIGKGLTESKFVSGEGGAGSFGMSVEAAQQKLGTLKSDSAWSSKFIKGDKDAIAELTRLHEIIAGGA